MANELNGVRAVADRTDTGLSPEDRAKLQQDHREDAQARAGEDLDAGADAGDAIRSRGGDGEGGDGGEPAGDGGEQETKASRRALIAQQVRDAREAEQQQAMGEIDGGRPRQDRQQDGGDGQGQGGKPYRIEAGDDGVEYGVLKINGQEVRRPMSKIFEQAQKSEAVEQRMEKATVAIRSAQGLYQDLNRREADIAAREARLTQLRKTVTNDNSQLSDKDVANVDTYLGTFIDALLDDDKEKAAEAFRKAVALGRGDAATPALSDAEAGKIVDKELAATRQRQHEVPVEISQAITDEWNEAKTAFIEDHPDIKEGSPRWELAAEYSKIIGQDPAFKGKGFNAIFREAGRRVRAFYGDKTQQDDRLQRKIDSHQHVAQRGPGGGGRQQQQEQAPQAESQYDKVMKMRKRRRPNEAY